jgi:hypothetical protein
MARLKPRLRISIKDHATGRTLKVELIEQVSPGRYWIRQDGKRPARHPEGEPFDGLRAFAALDGESNHKTAGQLLTMDTKETRAYAAYSSPEASD